MQSYKMVESTFVRMNFTRGARKIDNHGTPEILKPTHRKTLNELFEHSVNDLNYMAISIFYS